MTHKIIEVLPFLLVLIVKNLTAHYMKLFIWHCTLTTHCQCSYIYSILHEWNQSTEVYYLVSHVHSPETAETVSIKPRYSTTAQYVGMQHVATPMLGQPRYLVVLLVVVVTTIPLPSSISNKPTHTLPHMECKEIPTHHTHALVATDNNNHTIVHLHAIVCKSLIWVH